jgi:hypothetical protein
MLTVGIHEDQRLAAGGASPGLDGGPVTFAVGVADYLGTGFGRLLRRIVARSVIDYYDFGLGHQLKELPD